MTVAKFDNNFALSHATKRQVVQNADRTVVMEVLNQEGRQFLKMKPDEFTAAVQNIVLFKADCVLKTRA